MDEKLNGTSWGELDDELSIPYFLTPEYHRMEKLAREIEHENDIRNRKRIKQKRSKRKQKRSKVLSLLRCALVVASIAFVISAISLVFTILP